MDRLAADSLLAEHENDLVAALEGPIPTARELERQLLASDIPVMLARPPQKACCGGACGCSAKLQLLVRETDLPRVGQFMQQEWLEAVKREGTGGAPLVPLQFANAVDGDAAAAEADGPLTCPACGFQGALVEGACGDCGLQLE